MDKSTCPRCGGQIIASGNGRFQCKHCRFILPEEITNEELTLLYGANQQLRIGNFDEAEALFRDLTERYPKSSEGHWGLVLARYGIKYEKDYDGSLVPSCYATQYESVFEDADYKKALTLANEDTAAEYRATAETIEKVRVEWLEKASKEIPYDIFLSYKDTEADGTSKTDDYNRVYELYNHLTGLGYRVFFARVSLRDKAGEKNYEPYIFNALNTAHAMIVYASKPEYVTATWVKNEWMRFYRRMRDGKKQPNSLVVAYAGFNAGLLPKPLDHIQNFDANALTFLTELDAYLERTVAQGRANSGTFERVSVRAKPAAAKRVEKTKLRKAGATASVKPSAPTRAAEVKTRTFGGSDAVLTADEEGLINIASTYLESGQFSKALNFIDQILTNNSNNGKALYLSLLAKEKCANSEQLAAKLSSLNDYASLVSVIDHGGKEVAAELLSACCSFVAESLKEGKDVHAALTLYRHIAAYSHGGVQALHYLIFLNAKKLYSGKAVPTKELDEACSVAFSFLLDDAGNCQEVLKELAGPCNDPAFRAMADARLKEYDAQFGQDAFSLKARLVYAHGKKNATEALASLSVEEIGECDGLIQSLGKEEAIVFLSDCAEAFAFLLKQLNQNASISLEEICVKANRWAQLILSYDYPGRDAFIAKLTNAVKDNCRKEVRPLFATVIQAVTTDAEKRAEEIARFASALRAKGFFADAVQEYDEAIAYAPGNSDLYFQRLLASCQCENEGDLTKKNLIGLLDVKGIAEPYLATAKDDAELQAMLEKLMVPCLTFAADASLPVLTVGEALLRYYPESAVSLVASHARQLGDCARAKAKKETRPVPRTDAFMVGERLYKIAIGINKKDHAAHWGLLLCALRCADNEELINSPTPIGERKEFSDAIVAAGNNKEAVAAYVQIDGAQQKQLQRKANSKKRKKRTAIIISSLTAAVMAAVAVVLSVNVWIVPNSQRDEAIAMANVGDYDKALTTFKALNPSTHPEAPKLISAAMAGKALKANNFAKAVEYIESAGGTCDVQYDGNGGNVIQPNKAKKLKASKELPTATKNGYSFLEWKIMDYSYKLTVDNVYVSAKVKAEYSLSRYEITYDLGGGTNAESNPRYYTVESPSFTLANPAKAGYDFKGWMNGEGKSVTTIANGSTGNLSLTAVWAPTLWNLSATSDDPARGTASIAEGQGYTGETIRVSVVPNEGYSFYGWYEGSTKVSESADYSFTMPARDLVLTAKYAISQYQITYDLAGGTNAQNNPTSYTVETPMITLSDPTKEGYDFKGWKKGDDTLVTSIPQGSTGDLALTAAWSPALYNLSVASDDPARGTVSIAEGQGYFGETVRVVASPEEGYFFTGWYEGSTKASGDAEYSFAMPARDLFLNAEFKSKAEEEEEKERRAKAYGTKPILSSDGKTVAYGLYPQKRVSDSSVVSALNSISEPESNGYYLYQDVYYAKTVAKPNKPDYVFDDGTTIVSGTTYWFECKPITWKVLSETDGTYYVLSDVSLDAHRYAASSNNYANSEIRAWLNGEFLGSAFALDDSAIQTTTVDNSAATTSSTSNPYVCENTQDKVFLPSYKDYINSSYGFSTSTGGSNTRYAKASDWARARGAYYYTSSDSYQYNSNYWTRSPYSDWSYYAWYVHFDGYLTSGPVGYTDIGVRPSLSIVIA